MHRIVVEEQDGQLLEVHFSALPRLCVDEVLCLDAKCVGAS